MTFLIIEIRLIRSACMSCSFIDSYVLYRLWRRLSEVLTSRPDAAAWTCTSRCVGDITSGRGHRCNTLETSDRTVQVLSYSS